MELFCNEIAANFLNMSVTEIKQAIARLTPEEYCELMAELRTPLEDDAWDSQMKADAAAGKLDFVDRNIEQAGREGTLLPIKQIIEA